MTIETHILDINKAQDIQTAKDILLQGGRVAIPTETVYGLGAIATNEDAVKSVFVAKNRPLDHPLIVHIGNESQLNYWVDEISQAARCVMNVCWPGPLTLIFKKKPQVSSLISAGLDTVAIRMPGLRSIRDLIADLPHGLVAPSANPHKQLSPTTAAHVKQGLGGKIEAILDGGACDVGLESTILDVSGNELQILRAGPYSQEQLAQITNMHVAMPMSHSVKVAGNMKAHYQPITPLVLVESAELEDYIGVGNSQSYAVLHVDSASASAAKICFNMPTDRAGYARKLYQTLHQADHSKTDTIVVEVTPQIKSWPEIMNRLERASHR